MLHHRLGHSIAKLIPSTQQQHTITISTHTKPQYYALSLHCIGFGLCTLWQESCLHTCIPMQEANSYFLANSLALFLTYPSTQMEAAKNGFDHCKLLKKNSFYARVVAVAIVLLSYCQQAVTDSYKLSAQAWPGLKMCKRSPQQKPMQNAGKARKIWVERRVDSQYIDKYMDGFAGLGIVLSVCCTLISNCLRRLLLINVRK